MNGMMSRLGWLGRLGLGWLGLSSEAEAWERPPVKVDTVFQFRVNVHVGPQVGRPTAPWYTYFPADPRLVPSPQGPIHLGPPVPAGRKLRHPQRQTRSERQGRCCAMADAIMVESSAVGYVPMSAPVIGIQSTVGFGRKNRGQLARFSLSSINPRNRHLIVIVQSGDCE